MSGDWTSEARRLLCVKWKGTNWRVGWKPKCGRFMWSASVYGLVNVAPGFIARSQPQLSRRIGGYMHLGAAGSRKGTGQPSWKIGEKGWMPVGPLERT